MTITNEHLIDIDRAFDADVLKEFFQLYKDRDTAPSAKVLGALARVYGKTTQELEIEFRRFQKTLSVRDVLRTVCS